jgi:hypothetical protein
MDTSLSCNRLTADTLESGAMTAATQSLMYCIDSVVELRCRDRLPLMPKGLAMYEVIPRMLQLRFSFCFGEEKLRQDTT